MLLNQNANLNYILVTIYCFVDDFIKALVGNLKYALQRPDQNTPPLKTYNISVAELVTLGIFRHFTGHKNWKDFYRHIVTYHMKDFPKLPTYGNFVKAVNRLSMIALMFLHWFMKFFKSITKKNDAKFADSSKLEVCRVKREFTHKVCKQLASKSKSTMGWFYGFKLHIICNELMQILNFRITTGNVDDRKGLEMIWNDILGVIVADAGYVGKNWQEKAVNAGKILLAATRANMKKILTAAEYLLLKMRQRVESVFSVLKLRLGMESTLSRSPLGYFAHYIWCITAYQLDRFVAFTFQKLLPA